MKATILAIVLGVLGIVVFVVLTTQLRLAEQPSSSSGGAGSRIGHTADDGAAAVRFTLTSMRLRQAISDDPPYATDDGAWTVFECVPNDDPHAVLTVAVPTFVRPVKGQPVVFSKAVIWTGDRATGDRIVNVFAKGFHQPVPIAKSSSSQPLKPMKLTTAVLGENVRRDGDAFTGEGGTWTATKWFLEDSGQEAEIFFNYDVVNRVGEFSQKDSAYDAALIALLAQGLRDGAGPAMLQRSIP